MLPAARLKCLWERSTKTTLLQISRPLAFVTAASILRPAEILGDNSFFLLFAKVIAVDSRSETAQIAKATRTGCSLIRDTATRREFIRIVAPRLTAMIAVATPSSLRVLVWAVHSLLQNYAADCPVAMENILSSVIRKRFDDFGLTNGIRLFRQMHDTSPTKKELRDKCLSIIQDETDLGVLSSTLRVLVDQESKEFTKELILRLRSTPPHVLRALTPNVLFRLFQSLEALQKSPALCVERMDDFATEVAVTLVSRMENSDLTIPLISEVLGRITVSPTLKAASEGCKHFPRVIHRLATRALKQSTCSTAEIHELVTVVAYLKAHHLLDSTFASSAVHALTVMGQRIAAKGRISRFQARNVLQLWLCLRNCRIDPVKNSCARNTLATLMDHPTALSVVSLCHLVWIVEWQRMHVSRTTLKHLLSQTDVLSTLPAKNKVQVFTAVIASPLLRGEGRGILLSLSRSLAASLPDISLFQFAGLLRACRRHWEHIQDLQLISFVQALVAAIEHLPHVEDVPTATQVVAVSRTLAQLGSAVQVTDAARQRLRSVLTSKISTLSIEDQISNLAAFIWLKVPFSEWEHLLGAPERLARQCAEGKERQCTALLVHCINTISRQCVSEIPHKLVASLQRALLLMVGFADRRSIIQVIEGFARLKYWVPGFYESLVEHLLQQTRSKAKYEVRSDEHVEIDETNMIPSAISDVITKSECDRVLAALKKAGAVSAAGLFRTTLSNLS